MVISFNCKTNSEEEEKKGKRDFPGLLLHTNIRTPTDFSLSGTLPSGLFHWHRLVCISRTLFLPQKLAAVHSFRSEIHHPPAEEVASHLGKPFLWKQVVQQNNLSFNYSILISSLLDGNKLSILIKLKYTWFLK